MKTCCITKLNILFQAKLTDSRATISAMEESLAQSGSKLEKLERELDLKRSEGEKLALQLAEISGNAMTSAKSLTSRNDSLQKMVKNVIRCRVYLIFKLKHGKNY